MSSDRKVYTSDICIDGKRITAMREIAMAAFGESFLFIEVSDGRFIVRVNDMVDINSYYKFTDRYKLCKVLILREVSISVLVNERRK